ncbi:MAG: translation initiation factor IF-3 [Myxococcota bacterium]
MRVNERIRIREVRVIDSDGAQLGILPTEQALHHAYDKGLDLVEVSPMTRPPVCKIMDYGKFKYQQKKRDHEARKHQTVIELKEVKFRPKTEDHDIEFKVAHIKRFIEEGSKVKLTLMFRGREMSHLDLGAALMHKIIGLTTEYAKVEQMPKTEGRNMYAILCPKTV